MARILPPGKTRVVARRDSQPSARDVAQASGVADAEPVVAGRARPAAVAAGRAARRRPPLDAAGRFAVRHRVFLLLLAAGAALRVVTLFAYRPALIYFDSTRYLENMAQLEPKGVRPLGYSAFLRVLPLEHDLTVVPAVQHVLGLLMAVLLYALLLRLGVKRWLAALATAPVLLDAFQLKIEQYILSETLFDALLLGACALLLWRRRPRAGVAALAGLLLAAATLTRSSGTLLVVPAMLAVLLLRGGPLRAGVLLAAFAIPLAAYAGWFQSVHGVYSLTTYGGRFLYARVAPFADCAKVPVPPRQRVLCPTQPVGHRPTVEQFMWSNRLSPVYRLRHVTAIERSKRAGAFAKQVILHQPLDYARVVARDFLRGFEPTRTRHAGELPISRWKFQTAFPIYRRNTNAVIRRYGRDRGRVSPSLARFVVDYQRFGIAPGPLLGLALVLAGLGAVGVGRARRGGLRTACLLFAAMGVLLILTSVAVNQFTWRYWLPELVFLPAAGALGAAALWGRFADGPPHGEKELRRLFIRR
jgi:Dolichyl-phosphate-mannose-protein mannosyltransferase